MFTTPLRWGALNHKNLHNGLSQIWHGTKQTGAKFPSGRLIFIIIAPQRSDVKSHASSASDFYSLSVSTLFDTIFFSTSDSFSTFFFPSRFSKTSLKTGGWKPATCPHFNHTTIWKTNFCGHKSDLVFEGISGNLCKWKNRAFMCLGCDWQEEELMFGRRVVRRSYWKRRETETLTCVWKWILECFKDKLKVRSWSDLNFRSPIESFVTSLWTRGCDCLQSDTELHDGTNLFISWHRFLSKLDPSHYWPIQSSFFPFNCFY